MRRPTTDRSRYSVVIIGMGEVVEAAVLVARFFVDFRAVFFFRLAFEDRFFGDFLAAFFPAFFLVDFLAVFLAAFFFFAISSGSFRYSARVTSVGLFPRALTVGERHQEYDCFSISAAFERLFPRAGDVFMRALKQVEGMRVKWSRLKT